MFTCKVEMEVEVNNEDLHIDHRKVIDYYQVKSEQFLMLIIDHEMHRHETNDDAIDRLVFSKFHWLKYVSIDSLNFQLYAIYIYDIWQSIENLNNLSLSLSNKFIYNNHTCFKIKRMISKKNLW